MPSVTTEGQSCTSEYIDMVFHMSALYQCHYFKTSQSTQVLVTH